MKKDPRLDEFKNWLLDNTSCSPSTAKVYAQSVGSCLRSTDGHVRKALGRELAESTKIALHSALVHWARFTEDEQLLAWLSGPEARRAIHDRSSTRPKHVRRPLDPSQVDAVLGQLDTLWGLPPEDVAPWVWPVVRITLVLGLRARSDTTWIQRQAVVSALEEGAAGWSIWTKGAKQRVLPVQPVLTELSLLASWEGWAVVADLIAPDAAEGERRHEVAYGRLVLVLKELARRAGMDPKQVYAHRFRHSAALRLYEASGHNIIAVQQLLGHSNLETTRRYLQADNTKEIGETLADAYHGKGKQ